MILSREIYRPILLASGSPRRSRILTMMGIEFELAKSGVEDEDAYIDHDDLDASLQRLARAKAEPASKCRPEALVLGADTTVAVGKEILGKAADRADAARMLRTLSGRKHIVITAVALLCGETEFRESTAIRTEVFFRTLTEEEIQHYLSSNEYEDKAGAYAVQGGAMTFIDRIEGCYYNVMGLPVTATLGLFKKFIGKEPANARK